MSDNTSTLSPSAKRQKMKRPIIDCDIHHYTGFDKITPYLPREYQELIKSYGRALPESMHFNGGIAGRMNDSFPPEGGPAGSSLEYMRKHHLDPYNIKYGIMTGESLGIQATSNADYAAACCRAVNDYTIEHWLSQDDRLRGSVYIPKQDPIASAQEIDRIGGRSDMVQVLVQNGAFLPYGNRFYYPIYEACVRHNLPFTIHVSGEGVGINGAPTGAGHVTHYVESRTSRIQVMMAHLSSLIFEGVFDRFPTLKVVLQEAGVFWLAPYLWKLDQDWKGLRVQTPWVRKKPSEYFRSHVRVTTQPIEETPNRATFDMMMEHVYAKETVMFCSDYPHWDYDSPLLALPRMEEELAHKVYYQNAAELYNLPLIPRSDEDKSEVQQ